MRAAIETADASIGGLISVTDQQTVLSDLYGKEWIKRAGMSPDSYVQMALQLAYKRMSGRTDSTYESANTKRFMGGRTETIRSVTAESVRFTDTWLSNSASASEKVGALRAATLSHGKRVWNGNLARGIDRHLFVLLQLAKHRQQRVIGADLPELFTDPSYSTVTTNVLSTSNVSTPFSDYFGFGSVTAGGLALAYSIEPSRLCFNISSYTQKAPDFAKALGGVLEEMRDMVEDAGES